MSIHGGTYHILFVSEGKLFGFGSNENYRLSQGKRGIIRNATEIRIPGSPKIIKFTNGISSYTTVVLTTAGLFGCGFGGKGIFGDGTNKDRKTMKLLEFYKDKQVEGYWSESFALWVQLKNHRVLRSGSNGNGRLGNKTKKDITIPEYLHRSFLTSKTEIVADIKAYWHTILLTDQGRVYACGHGGGGKRGMGEDDTGKRTTFGKITFFEKKGETKDTFHQLSGISVGRFHSLFVNLGGICYSCGNGKAGATGMNDTKTRYLPAAIDSLKKEKITKVCSGEEFSMFLSQNNTVFGCGRNDECQTGLGTYFDVLVPTKVSTKLQIVDFATTQYSSTFVTSNGYLYSVGFNDHEQCGVGNTKSPIKTLTATNIQINSLRALTPVDKKKPFVDGKIFEELSLTKKFVKEETDSENDNFEVLSLRKMVVEFKKVLGDRDKEIIGLKVREAKALARLKTKELELRVVQDEKKRRDIEIQELKQQISRKMIEISEVRNDDTSFSKN